MLSQKHMRRIAAVSAMVALLLYSFPGAACTADDSAEESTRAEDKQRSCVNGTAENEINTSETEKGLSGNVRFAPLPAMPEYEEHFTQAPERLAGGLFLTENERFGSEEIVRMKDFTARFGSLFACLFTVRE